ncbi:probable receptor-like protein kinase At5g24010 [Neltuma alba]|uniref:probable receptor-like protein kinase At5g24010 n=1 Tax=Neltuma alba TaxID=207710 RepID=UPI0010A53285|nr:probable receptor-like protein kinase At5g24010 [Prosopis alba]
MEFLQVNLVSCFLLLCFRTLSVYSRLFSPVDNYLIDCGSAAVSTIDNRRFVGDLSGNDSPLSFSGRSISIRNENPVPGLAPVYRTVRIFRSPSKYAFPIRDKGTHMVRLHFNSFNSPGFDLGDAQFHVLVDEFIVLSNFSRVRSENPRIMEYLIRVDAEKLVIMFVPTEKSKFAFVNAIEVISAPKDLVPDTAQYVSSKNVVDFDGLSNQALEVVYRLNVGGPKVTPFNDSLWRTWMPDGKFFKPNYASQRLYFGGRIKYQRGGASREVGPDNMYNSARLIKSKNASVPMVNMTWQFPVIGGYKYLVRMHFCDIASISIGLLYFNVYVNGHLAYADLDLSGITGLLASPFYADFVVDEDSLGALSVNIGPSNKSIPYVVDGILNGIEIFRLNNSHNSLDGEDCAGFVLKNWSRGNSGLFLTLVAAICIVLSISLLIRRRIVGSGDSFPWSRLPVDISDHHVKISGLHSESK